MKSTGFIAILFVIFQLNGICQNSTDKSVPELKTNEGKVIVLDKYYVNVEVVGNIAITTCEMFFLNNENRVLEGELTFPLKENQTISRFALEVNGKLREGVAVEKQKGQEVFEAIERRGVDPGLLEHVQGNVFRSRIYPIPAKAYKHVLIAYQQELKSTEKGKQYDLPLNLDRKIGEFKLNIEVYKQTLSPQIIEGIKTGIRFIQWKENYSAKANYADVYLNQKLSFLLPNVPGSNRVFVEKGKVTGKNYFYFETKINDDKIKTPEYEFITIFWDVSFSVKRNIDNELTLLKKYFNKHDPSEVKLVLFANEIVSENTYGITNGNYDELFQLLQNVTYDGGTQLGNLDFSTVKKGNVILFSDGMGTYGNQDFNVGDRPVIVVNSSAKANHSLLNFLAITSGGKYLNLNELNISEAIDKMTYQNYRLISVDHDESISDFVPSVGNSLMSNFSCAGILNSDKTDLTLNFGYGSHISFRKKVTISTKDLNPTNMVEKIWAQKKLYELDLQYEKNKRQIAELGKKFNLVTRNTSLIVLETVNDYIQYEIVPPQELLAEYNKRIIQRDRRAKETEIENINRAVRLYNEKIRWWEKDYKPEYIKPVYNVNNNTGQTNEIPTREYSSTTKNVSGRIIDSESGESFQGVSVVVKGTNQGVLTDRNGNFTITVPVNAVLNISFIGYVTEEIDVENISGITISLVQETTQLEEVVVIGYGTQRRSDITGSITSVQEGIVVQDDMEIANIAYMAEDNESTNILRSKKATESRINKGVIYLKPWNPNAPYLEKFNTVDKSEYYKTYLEIRKDYEDVPSFFADVSEFFYTKKMNKVAVRVLSNLAEIQLLSHELLRVLAHKLEVMKEYTAAIEIYKKVLEIREEEPQSYRDLAIAYNKAGKCQEAVDLLYKAITMKWDDRFPGIEAILASEMNEIIYNEKNKIDIRNIDKGILKNLPVDIRVVLNWDADNTDMDLWVTDPKNEKCFYSHKETKIGGRMSNDFTRGYGPEEFMLKKAVDGKYLIQANYYGSSQQKISGPVTIYLELYLNYGKPDQELKEITLRLSDDKEVVDIADFEFESK